MASQPINFKFKPEAAGNRNPGALWSGRLAAVAIFAGFVSTISVFLVWRFVDPGFCPGGESPVAGVVRGESKSALVSDGGPGIDPNSARASADPTELISAPLDAARERIVGDLESVQLLTQRLVTELSAQQYEMQHSQSQLFVPLADASGALELLGKELVALRREFTSLLKYADAISVALSEIDANANNAESQFRRLHEAVSPPSQDLTGQRTPTP